MISIFISTRLFNNVDLFPSHFSYAKYFCDICLQRLIFTWIIDDLFCTNVSVGTRLYVWVRSQMKNRGKEVQMSCRKKEIYVKRWDTFFNTIKFILFCHSFGIQTHQTWKNVQLSNSQALRIRKMSFESSWYDNQKNIRFSQN